MMTPRIISFLILLLVTTATCLAQPGGGGDPGGGQPVPFSGLGLLLTAGAALGIKTLHSLRKRDKE